MRAGLTSRRGAGWGPALQRAGLVHVATREVRMPAGRRAGLGAMLEANLMGLLGAVKPQLVAARIVTPEQWDAVVGGIWTDIANGQCFWLAHLAYGQRLR